jgi:hypothetical protein
VKRTPWLISVLAICLLAFGIAGCKKSGGSPPQTLEDGLLKMRAALIKASPAVQSDLYNGVDNGIRYGRYPEALAALDRIAADPGLNPEQKKLVADVTALMQAKVQNAPKPGQ